MSLMQGVEEAAAATLQVASISHRSASPPPERMAKLVDTVLDQVEENWRAGRAGEKFHRSRANWRWWGPQAAIAPHNRSREVVLERAIAAAAIRRDDRRWANQVPVSSGLSDGSAERRRAIDLVEQRGEDHFAFFELKIASDTPLYATVELLGYAAIWLLTRESECCSLPPLLAAKRIDLRVLAPVEFYRSPGLQDLETAVDASVARRALLREVRVSFRFDVLDAALTRSDIPDDATLLARLADSRPLFPRALFLPGVPEARVRAALDAAGGNEIASGKFANPQSSAALAANGFGWFLERPSELPPFPELDDLDWPAREVAVERGMRFPWAEVATLGSMQR